MLDAKAKDQGHRRKCSPKTKERKTGLQNFFSGDIQKKGLQNFFSGSLQQKRSTKFQQFKELRCPRAEDRAIFVDLKLRGQGLQNKS